jgi:putative transposase
VNQVLNWLGKTRQAYHRRSHQRVQQALPEALIVAEVQAIRRQLPLLGGRKLFYKLQPAFQRWQMTLGRDRFFELLRRYRLLLPPRKRTDRTTQSRHLLPPYGNLIKALDLTGPQQVWVADITYLRLVNGFAYLALLTDAWSRKIVGYDVSTSLSLDGSLRALNMALTGDASGQSLIHHSDRGLQYCSREYVNLLQARGVRVSMTEDNHVYENALAERVNGILKTEFLLDAVLLSLSDAQQRVREAIRLYNNERPHLSLGYLTPSQKHAA